MRACVPFLFPGVHHGEQSCHRCAQLGTSRRTMGHICHSNQQRGRTVTTLPVTATTVTPLSGMSSSATWCSSVVTSVCRLPWSVAWRLGVVQHGVPGRGRGACTGRSTTLPWYPVIYQGGGIPLFSPWSLSHQRRQSSLPSMVPLAPREAEISSQHGLLSPREAELSSQHASLPP